MIPARVPILLAPLVLLGIAASFVEQLSRGNQEDANAEHVVASADPVVLAVPVPPLRPLQSFSSIWSRPLFSESRRPQPDHPHPVIPKPAPVEQDGVPQLNKTLVGVVLSPEHGAAILRGTDGSNKVVAQGEAVEGWVLKQVTATGVSFAHGEAQINLAFSRRQADVPDVVGEATLAPIRRRRR